VNDPTSPDRPALSLAGRTILVTGGTSGAGLAGVIECHGLGAGIVLGSRSEERYREVAARLGGGRLRPFVADLGDAVSLERALDALRRDGTRPTDVVHCAAGGLEPILRPLLRTLAATRRLPPGSERERALAAHRRRLGELVERTAELAWRVNSEGPRRVVAELAPALPPGARLVAYSSTWTAVLEAGGCPIFYRAIAESKAAFETWLSDRAQAWVQRRITPTIVVSPLIADTTMGRLIDRNLVPIVAEADRKRWRATFVSTADVTAAVTRLLTTRAAPPPRLYVLGPGSVRHALDQDVIAAAGRVPL
jgi:NAD(P)-dependent dehydrogenase (short-subunit alcohol dehydrogenase family)